MANDTPEIEEEGGIISSVGDGLLWVVDNGLYNTKAPWYSGENLFNIGFLGASVVAGAFTAGGGTAAMLAGRVAVGAAAKGALRAAAVEVAVSAPIMAAANPVLGAVNDKVTELLGEDNEAPSVEEPASEEAAPETELAAEMEEPAAEQQSWSEIFNAAVDKFDDYVPMPIAIVLAGVTTLFNNSAAISPDGVSDLVKTFAGAAFGETKMDTAEAEKTVSTPRRAMQHTADIAPA